MNLKSFFGRAWKAWGHWNNVKELLDLFGWRQMIWNYFWGSLVLGLFGAVVGLFYSAVFESNPVSVVIAALVIGLLFAVIVFVFALIYALMKIDQSKVPTLPSWSEDDPDQEVLVSDAIWRAFLGRWERPAMDLSGPGIGEEANQRLYKIITKEFRQHAFDGRLTIRAIPRGSNLLVEVPKTFWKDHLINYLTILHSQPEDLRVIDEATHKQNDDYSEYVVSRGDVDRLWPVKEYETTLNIPTAASPFEIVFADDGRFVLFDKGVKTYRVHLLNRGPTQKNVSYRLEAIQNADGSYVVTPHGHPGMQREDGQGPCPLSTNSPKFGRLVRMNETDPQSKIEMLTLAPITENYALAPIFLDRGTYLVTVSLNPRQGLPRLKTFRVSVDGGQLRVREAPDGRP